MAVQPNSAIVDQAAIEVFKQAMRGEVLQPGEAGYDEARSLWNAMIDKRPALIACCTSSDDVIAAVNFGRDNDLLISVRGGGHNVAGNAVCDDGLMIDLSRMNAVALDLEVGTATAGPGAVFGDLDKATQPHGMAVPGGIVSETGIAGLTLGGGFGWLTRKHGFTSDNLVAADVVTVDGRLITVSERENPELFWGIRGGGGNFGVVTSFTYQMRPVGEEVLGGLVFYPLDEAANVLRFFRRFTATTPVELGAMAVFLLAPPAPFLPEEVHGTPVLALIVCYNGDLEEGERVLQPLRDYGNPLFDGIARKPFAVHNSFLDAGQPSGKYYYWKSEYVTEIADGAIDLFVDYGSRMSSPFARLAMFHLGGNVQQIDELASAASHRSAEYIFAVNTGWGDPAETEGQMQWTHDLWTALRPFSMGGVYVNFLSADDGEDRVRAAYGAEKYERLVELKRRYDPQNLFKMNKNISPG